jgi:metallo-beta-lactamase family protein
MHLVELANGTKFLLDCGIFQGGDGFHEEMNREFPCDPSEIEALILSHAHIDHCGNIPQLVRAGFRGNIFCTSATRDLCSIMLSDSAQIQEKDAEYDNKHRKRKGLPMVEPLYTTEDVAPALERFVTFPYQRRFSVCDGVEVEFRDAGHMLGSASVTVYLQEGKRSIKLGFTGDIGRPGRPILRDPVAMPEVDFLISESTYGGVDHESTPESEENLLKVVYDTCIKRRGKLIIPAFSVGRTQEIIYVFDKLENQKRLPPIPVYVDSPMAVDATRVFEMHPECFDNELVQYMKRDPSPFAFSKLHYVRSVESSRQLNDLKGPAIIISASGMITAGRILHHVKHNVGDADNTILLVGYCAKGTIGARLAAGEKRIRIHGQEHEVKANVEKLSSFSGHAGQTELFEFIHQSQKPADLKRLFLVHGEEERSEAFAKFMREKGYANVHNPMRGETFEL